MNKLLIMAIIGSFVTFNTYEYHGSTTAAVSIAGAIIKAQNIEISKKYKRKECPVCKGNGWYISGDKITKVNCGYCEPEKTEINNMLQQSGTCHTTVKKR